MRISGAMVADALAEQSQLASEAKRAYEATMAVRDDLIRSARLDARIPVAVLMRMTGLGRDRISKITSAPSRTDTDR